MIYATSIEWAVLDPQDRAEIMESARWWAGKFVRDHMDRYQARPYGWFLPLCGALHVREVVSR